MVVSSLQGNLIVSVKRRPRCDFAADGVSIYVWKGKTMEI